LSAPLPGQVVITVAGAALGVDPRAEIAGTVSAVGEAAGEWLGKRVVVPRILPCGDCNACRRGRVAHCRSRAARNGLGATETVAARWLCSVEPPLWPEALAPDELWQLAALADAALAPYTALSRAGVGPSDRVVIVGRDARARFAAAIAAAKGAAVVTTGVADDGAAGSCDGAVILAAGVADRRRALELAGEGSTVVLLDGADDKSAPFAIDWAQLVNAEAHVLGSVGGHPDLLPELCALVVRGQLSLASAVRRVTLDEAARAHAAYLSDGGPLPIAVP
jgi:threonine dehydrogenase-like Zn-dependent dehydrogenase